MPLRGVSTQSTDGKPTNINVWEARKHGMVDVVASTKELCSRIDN
jgi:hypothetical protein